MTRVTRNRNTTLVTRRSALLGLLAASAATLPALACARRQPAKTVPTSVDRGERVETGAPIYDEYFGTVHELHVLVTTAELEERDARSSLATMLGLLPTAGAEQLLEKLAKRTKTLPGMRLELDEKAVPHTARIALVEGAKADERVKGLMTVLEATANAELSLSHRMGELPERAHRVHNVGAPLTEGAARDFSDRPPAERDQIAAELRATEDLLRRLAKDAQTISDDAEAFVQRLVKVLEATSGTGPEPARPAEDTKGRSGRSGSRPESAPSKPPATNQTDDFNP